MDKTRFPASPRLSSDAAGRLLVRQQGGSLDTPLVWVGSTPDHWRGPLGAVTEVALATEGGGSDDRRRQVCIVEESASLEKTRCLLEAAYRDLSPGDLVLVIGTTGSRRASPAGRSWREVVTTELFRAGFDNPRLLEEGKARLAVAARSALAPPSKRAIRLSVVLPVYNEIATFGTVIDELLAKELDGVDIEIIIVESNSTDGTRAAVLELEDHPRVRLVLEDRPRGKGHAVRAGIDAAEGDFLLIQDADLEYRLDDYERLLAPLRSYEASFVLGERSSTIGTRRGLRHFDQDGVASQLMNIGHVLFLRLFNLVYRSHLADPFTMYKVLRRDCLNGIKLECNRFDFDWELVGKLIRLGHRPLEIPVSYHSRSFAEGKKISVIRDPLTWLVACFKYRFAPLEE